MAKVSVIIPVYNAEKYLEQCISSIANQTMRDVEILAINDGSVDNSLNILDRLSSRYKGRLKIYNKENGGAGSARNVGLEHASGEFVKFVDADDYLGADILEKMYQIAKENKVSLVRGNYRTILGPLRLEDKCSWSDINGSQIVNLKQNKDYIVTETPGIGNKLISRDLLGDLRFPEKTKWEDLAIIPVVIASSERLFHLDETVYHYRMNSKNITITDFMNSTPHILDIIRCVENIEEQMNLKGLSEEYKSQIESLYILHTLFRIENAMFWINFPRSKKEVVVSSLLGILEAKYPNWRENQIVEQYRIKNSLFNFDMKRLYQFVNDKYKVVDRQIAEDNIRRVLR